MLKKTKKISLGRTFGELLAFEPRGRQHPGHLRLDDLPERDLLRRQERAQGNPDRHPEGSSADPVFRGSQSLGEDPGENGGHW